MQEISLHIMDLMQNSITAGATLITLSVEADEKEDTLSITLEDNGKGMDSEMLSRVTSPFTTTRTTRKVGLGIPLFKAGCEQTGGYFEINSTKGVGTKLKGVYVLSNVDRPPLGQIASTLHTLIICNPQIDFAFLVRRNEDVFELDTRQVRQILGDEVPLDAPDVSSWLLENLSEGIQEIFGGVNI